MVKFVNNIDVSRITQSFAQCSRDAKVTLSLALVWQIMQAATHTHYDISIYRTANPFRLHLIVALLVVHSVHNIIAAYAIFSLY